MTIPLSMYNRFRIPLILPLIIALLSPTCEEPVEEDTIPPTVSIQSPVSGQTVSEIVIISVSTQDNEGVEKVEFFIDDSLHYTDSNAPYEHAWNTTAYGDSSQHIIKAISYDEDGNLTESQPVLVLVDNSRSYPAPVDIISISFTLLEMTITWEMSKESDFDYYELLFSDSEYGEKSTLAVITEAADTVYSITDFDPTTESWYWVGVTDTVGLFSLGEGYFVIDDPPTVPNLLPISYSDNSFPISWEINSDQDFESYTLYEAMLVDMSDETAILTTTDQAITEYVVDGIGYDEYRYYRLVVRDIWGLESSGSIRTASSYLRIVFSSDRDGSSEIYTIDVNGNDLIRLTDAGSNNRPVLSPDGSKIAFRSERDDNREIYLINSDGSEEIRLTMHGDHDENPRFSPDGAQIVFTSYRDRASGDKEVYLMNIDGSSQTNLSDHSAYDDMPFFTHNGSFIIFRSNRGSGGNGEVFRMNIDGSNQINLTNMDGNETALDINSTGDVLYGAGGEYYLMDINGGNRRRLTNNDIFESGGQFSPDGTKIVYGLDDALMLMNADGTNKVKIVDGIIPYEPQISHDGQRIVFWGSGGILIVNTDGSDFMSLGEGKFPQFQPRL